MSAGGTWGKVPIILATAGASPLAVRVFIVMSSYAGGNTRLAWPSQDAIGEALRVNGRPVHRRNVRKALEELQDLGFIHREGRKVFGDGHWTNMYLVAPFPDGAAEAPTDDGALETPTSIGDEGDISVDLHPPDGAFSIAAMALFATHDGAPRAPLTDPTEQTTVPDEQKTPAPTSLRSGAREGENDQPSQPENRKEPTLSEEERKALELDRFHDSMKRGDGWRQVGQALAAKGLEPEDAFLRMARAWVTEPRPEPWTVLQDLAKERANVA